MRTAFHFLMVMAAIYIGLRVDELFGELRYLRYAVANQPTNARGYIRCVDGHWQVGNIDVSGSNTNGEYVVRLYSECEAQ